MTSQERLTETLRQILETDDGTIQAAVITTALDYHDPKAFFLDLFVHGCVSGMVSSLIYYADTHAFFDAHYEEIETLRIEAEENLGEPVPLFGDLKNSLAWFAFEETAIRLVHEIGGLR